MDRTRLVGIALILVSALAFGTGGVFAKPAYAAGLGWLVFLAWRFTIGAALAWAAILVRPAERRALRGAPVGSLVAVFALGVLYVGNAGTYYAGLELVPLSLAALLVYAYPPIVAVLAQWFGRPLEGRRAWASLGLAFVGVILAIGGIDTSRPPPIDGIALVVAAPVIYAIWILLSARVGGERHDGEDAETGATVSAFTAVSLTATAVTLWALGGLTGHRLLPGDIPMAAWGPLLGIGVISTFVSISTFYAGTRRVGAAQAALLSTVEPAFTITLAAVLFGDRLQPIQLLGGAVILGAVFLAQTGARRRGEAAPLPQPIVRLADD